MENWQKEALRRHRMAILDDLHVDYVVDHLLAHQILCEEHIEIIDSQIGRRKRATYLLDLLPSRGPAAYFEFVNALKVPYSWLSQILSQESEKSLTNAASTSQYYSNSAIESQQIYLNSIREEINQKLDNLLSVITKYEHALCAATSELESKLSGTNACVLRRNTINFSMNEESHTEPSSQVVMDRLRGGGDIEIVERQLYNVNFEEERVSPVPPVSTANLFDLGKEKFPFKKQDCDQSIDLVKTIDRVSDKEQIISSIMTNQLMQGGEYEQAVVENLTNDAMDEVDSVGFHSAADNSHQKGSSVAFAEKFMTSPNGELLKDSPDSGMGDVQLNQETERMDSHEIMSSSGISFLEESVLFHPSAVIDQKSGSGGSSGIHCENFRKN